MAFRSNEYAYKDIKMVLAGRPITGFRDISYTRSRETNKIYAAGDKPHSRTTGNITDEGSVTVLQSELEALVEAAQNAGYDDPTRLVFDITIAYAASVTDRIKTDQLVQCRITEFEKSMTQNDSNMEIELSLDIGEIKYNI